MTTTSTRRPITGQVATTLIGTPTQLANVITNHRTAGTLIAVGRPFPVPHRPGYYQIHLRLRAATTIHNGQRPTASPITIRERNRPARTRRTGGRAAIAAVITTAAAFLIGVTAAVAHLVGVLVQLVADHAPAVLTIAALAALLPGALVRRRRHCPGC
jgi:hypothetical protein